MHAEFIWCKEVGCHGWTPKAGKRVDSGGYQAPKNRRQEGTPFINFKNLTSRIWAYAFVFTFLDQALAESLSSDIPAMVSGLLNMGIEASVSIEDLTGKEGILY